MTVCLIFFDTRDSDIAGRPDTESVHYRVQRGLPQVGQFHQIFHATGMGNLPLVGQSDQFHIFVLRQVLGAAFRHQRMIATPMLRRPSFVNLLEKLCLFDLCCRPGSASGLREQTRRDLNHRAAFLPAEALQAIFGLHIQFYLQCRHMILLPFSPYDNMALCILYKRSVESVERGRYQMQSKRQTSRLTSLYTTSVMRYNNGVT